MDTPIARRTLLGGIALVATVQYLVAEAISAAAWTRVPYSYADNYISDLGVPECVDLADRTVCSPLHAVMSGGFVLQGILAFVALALLLPLVRARRRWLPLVFGVLHGVGLIMVGLFPGSFAENLGGDPQRTALHSVGALLAIAGGNLFATATGIAILGRWRIAGILSIAAGIIGLAPLAFAEPLTDALGVGGSERLLVYPFIAWLIALGAAIVIAVLKNRRTFLAEDDHPARAPSRTG